MCGVVIVVCGFVGWCVVEGVFDVFVYGGCVRWYWCVVW